MAAAIISSVLLLLLHLCHMSAAHAAVAPQHAELQQKGKQVFLKALQGESVFDRCAGMCATMGAEPAGRRVSCSFACSRLGGASKPCSRQHPQAPLVLLYKLSMAMKAVQCP